MYKKLAYFNKNLAQDKTTQTLYLLSRKLIYEQLHFSYTHAHGESDIIRQNQSDINLIGMKNMVRRFFFLFQIYVLLLSYFMLILIFLELNNLKL